SPFLREGVAAPLVAPRVVRAQLDGAVVNREHFIDVVALAGAIAAEIGLGVFPAWLRVALGFGDRLVVDRAVSAHVRRIAGPRGLGVEHERSVLGLLDFLVRAEVKLERVAQQYGTKAAFALECLEYAPGVRMLAVVLVEFGHRNRELGLVRGEARLAALAA